MIGGMVNDIADRRPKSTSSRLGKEKEFEYMLSELESERHLIDERQRRLEQVITFYLTIITAIIGATVAAAVTTSDTTFVSIAAVAALVGTAVGHITFFAMLGIISALVASHSHFYARRQYFIDRSPAIREYVEHRPNSEIREIWRSQFNRGTVLFLRLFVLFNCTLLGVFIFLLSLSIIAVVKSMNILVPFDPRFPAGILVTIVLGIALIYELRLILRRVIKAREFSYHILAPAIMIQNQSGE